MTSPCNAKWPRRTPPPPNPESEFIARSWVPPRIADGVMKDKDAYVMTSTLSPHVPPVGSSQLRRIVVPMVRMLTLRSFAPHLSEVRTRIGAACEC